MGQMQVFYGSAPYIVGEGDSFTAASPPNRPQSTTHGDLPLYVTVGDALNAISVPDSEAVTIRGIVKDFNDLLAALRAAGILKTTEEGDGLVE